MKTSVIAMISFVAAGVIAGGKPDNYCKTPTYNPPRCKAYYPGDVGGKERDLDDLEERDLDDLEERDLDDLEERDLDDLEERDDGLEERDEELDERDFSKLPRFCTKTCPKPNLKCTSYGYGRGKGHPKFKGGFSASVDCQRGSDYTVSGKFGSCKGGYGDCLVITYSGDYWRRGKETSYIGVYDSKWRGPKKVTDLNYSSYCSGNVCSIPVDEFPSYPDLCDKDFWIAYDGGHCKRGHPSSGYDKRKPAPYTGAISYTKLHVECYGKKECKSYCCDI